METPPLAAVEPPPVLSSSITIAYRFILPAAFVFLSAIFLSIAITSGGMFWLATLFLMAISLVPVMWARSLKFVEIKGDHLAVSNFSKTVLVPTRDLYFIEVVREMKPPSITLYFNPPTAFGKSITIQPPSDWKKANFDRATRWLQSQPNCRSSHPI